MSRAEAPGAKIRVVESTDAVHRFMFRLPAYALPLPSMQWTGTALARSRLVGSKVENMSHMFEDARFDEPLDGWDVSNMKDMSHMFESARSFKTPLDGWGKTMSKVHPDARVII